MQVTFMEDAFIYLGCAVLSVPIARKLGLGSVLGYLIAGISIGPFALGLVDNSDVVLQFAEFGVVMMLFLIGLELKPSLLWQLKLPILGCGGSQVIASTLVIFSGAFYLAHLTWQQSLAIAMILSISSTALVLQLLNEKGLMRTETGQSSFAILLFQDIAIIPMLALLPLLASKQNLVAIADTTLPGWQQAMFVALLIVGIFLAGHYLLRPMFRFIAASSMREIFVAAALLLVIGVSLAAHAVGLSPALGAFISGVVLAESEYRHELEADIEPFKGLLLGLFFISVGANINFALFGQSMWLILFLVLCLLLIKGAVVWGLGWILKMPLVQRGRFALSLAQGGEFAFVLFAFASDNHVLPKSWVQLLVLVVTLSMLLTPILLIIYERTVELKVAIEKIDTVSADAIDHHHNPVIIAGFGRFGQVAGRLLHAHGIGTTILEQDTKQLEMLRRFKYQVFYGDAMRLELLESAGAEHAKMMIIAIGNPVRSLQLVHMVRKHYPHLKLLVRAIDRPHAYQLINAGVKNVVRETFASAVDLGMITMLELGYTTHQASRAGRLFKRYDERFLRDQAEIYQDENLYISSSIQSRELLRELLNEDAEELEEEHGDTPQTAGPTRDLEKANTLT